MGHSQVSEVRHFFTLEPVHSCKYRPQKKGILKRKHIMHVSFGVLKTGKMYLFSVYEKTHGG